MRKKLHDLRVPFAMRARKKRLRKSSSDLLAVIAAITLACLAMPVVTSAAEEVPDSAGRLQKANELNACRASFRVVLDVGHSKKASGAISARGKTEYEFNTLLVSAIRERLLERGYSNVNVLVSSGGDGSLALRAEQANDLAANIFLSIHHDSVQPEYLEWWIFKGKKRQYSDHFRGFSLFVSRINKEWEKSFRFARILGDNLIKRGLMFSLHHAEDIPGERRTLLDRDRGIYQFDDLAVVKFARVPAVLLEAGVIVNREEERELGTAARRELIAASVVEAVDVFCLEGAPRESQ